MLDTTCEVGGHSGALVPSQIEHHRGLLLCGLTAAHEHWFHAIYLGR